jgi:hypothetical protein
MMAGYSCRRPPPNPLICVVPQSGIRSDGDHQTGRQGRHAKDASAQSSAAPFLPLKLQCAETASDSQSLKESHIHEGLQK